jgi:hypothetical protein
LETGRRVAGLLDAGAVKDISDEELSSFLQLLLAAFAGSAWP